MMVKKKQYKKGSLQNDDEIVTWQTKKKGEAETYSVKS
jgi:hypothetical protein